MLKQLRAWVIENGRAGAVLYMFAGLISVGLGATQLGAACLGASVFSALCYELATW